MDRIDDKVISRLIAGGLAAIAIVAGMAIALFFQNAAHAATPEDAARVAAMFRGNVPGLAKIHTGKATNNVQMFSFVQKNIYYTVYYVTQRDKNGPAMLAFLVQDEAGPRRGKMFLSCWLDGKIAEGVDGQGNELVADGRPKKKALLQWWQKKLDTTIHTVLRYRQRLAPPPE